jgi:hypothetical protein
LPGPDEVGPQLPRGRRILRDRLDDVHDGCILAAKKTTSCRGVCLFVCAWLTLVREEEDDQMKDRDRIGTTISL